MLSFGTFVETEADLQECTGDWPPYLGKMSTGYHGGRITKLTIAFAFRDREHHGQLRHIDMHSIGSIVLPRHPRPNCTNGSHFNRENPNCQLKNVTSNE
jgi:hypothetical protein